MASARLTFTQAFDLIRTVIRLVNIQFHTIADGTALTTAAYNFTTLESAFIGLVDGPRTRRLLDNLSGMRSDAVGMLLTAREILEDLVLEAARSAQVNSVAGDDFARAFRDVWLYMHNNNLWVRRRVASFGTPTAGTTTGTGKWYRCVKDVKNYDPESPQADTYTAECVADKTTGALSGQELFEIRGRAAGQDILEQLGLGLVRQLVVTSPATNLLDDGGFEGTFAVSGTALVGQWETDDASQFSEETTTKFRGSKSVKINAATHYLRQLVTNIDRSVPYFACVRVKDITTRTGTIRLTLGSKTKDYTLGANNNWNDLVIGATGLAIGSDAWPDNWLNGDSYFRVEATALGGTGDTFIDEAVFAPMIDFAGLYHTITAGQTDWKSGTPGDVWTAQDSFTDAGIIQFWTKLLLGRYWPHKPTGSYNVTDAT